MSRRKRTRPGRPTKAEGPAFPSVELDRLLVHGEVVYDGEGKPADIYFPTINELAERYSVSRSLISKYARDHNTRKRRKIAKERLAANVDREVITSRAEALALKQEDELRIIDTYLRGFEEALREGRVRFDNPTDFNTMLRLKNFINGGADSRQEVHTTLSLNDIQARHKEMLRAQRAGASLRGEDVVEEKKPSALTGIEVPGEHLAIEIDEEGYRAPEERAIEIDEEGYRHPEVRPDEDALVIQPSLGVALPPEEEAVYLEVAKRRKGR